MGIKQRLGLLLLATALLPLGAVASLLYVPAKEAVVILALQSLDSTASLQEARVRTAIESYLDMARLVASRTALRRSVDEYGRDPGPALRDRVNEILADAKGSVPTLGEITALDARGNVVGSTDPSRFGMNLSLDPSFVPAQRSFMIVDVGRGPDGAATIEIAGPLLLEGNVVGVVRISATMDRLTAVTDDYSGLGRSGETLLGRRTEDGGAIPLTPLRFDREAALTRRFGPQETSKPMLRALSGAEGTIQDGVEDYRGRRVFASVRYLDYVGWGLVVKMDEDEVFAPVAPLRDGLVLTTAGILLAIPVLAFAVVGSITKPLVQLTAAARRVREGDLSAKTGVRGSDEIGFLARAFDEMTEALAREKERVERQTAELAGLYDLSRAAERRYQTLSERLAAVSDFARSVNGTLELQPLFDLALQRLGALTGCGWANISEHDSAQELFRVRAIWSAEGHGSLTPGATVSIVDSASGVVLQSGKPYVVQDISEIPAPTERQRSLAGRSIRSRIAVPILIGDDFWGTLGIGFMEVGAGTPERVELLEAMAAHLAVAIRNASLYSETLTAQAELRRSNAELEQFAYVASHDLQEPVRGVVGCLQLLQRRHQNKLDAGADQLIHHAVDGSLRMQALVSDLLIYARAGKSEKPFEPVECSRAFARALESVQAAIQDSGATVTVDPLPRIVGDRVQFGQLFQNLLSNAIKFRGADPPRVHIGVERSESTWTFSVRDNGIGIEAQYAERIFAMFQRLHDRGQYPGTGIGLAICKRIVERHGGRIWVESQPGEGSTFHFTIPAVREASAA